MERLVSVKHDEFEIHELQPGEYDLMVSCRLPDVWKWSQTIQAVSLAPGINRIEVRIPSEIKTGSLKVRVTDTKGFPIKSCSLSAYDRTDYCGQHPCFSDREGIIVVRDLFPGHYRFIIQGNQHSNHWGEIVIQPGKEHELKVVLD